MSWLQNLFGKGSGRPQRDLDSIRLKFAHFLALLDHNNQVLRIMSDMEEKAQGEFLFDINYIQTNLEQIRAGVRALIEEMIALGGKDYLPLTTVYRNIDARIEAAMPGCRPISPDGLTIPYDRLGRDKACSVGSKNAQLGELKTRIGLPVPDGFAISGWAYQRFLDHNELQVRISKRIDNLDIRSLDALVQISREIQDMILEAEVPGDVAEAIEKAADELIGRCGSVRFSLRSSAIGEDTMFSFAGQYATVLNLGKGDLVEQYRWIIASKFTPQAIYYYLSHSLLEHGLAMSVGCVEMIDARSSGVIYTRDPVHPHDDCVLINSIYGLGPYLVDGTLTPDIFCVSRDRCEVGRRQIADKDVRLVLDKTGGTRSEAVPAELRTKASLSDDELRRLTEQALQIEKHYFSPQDIEWAIDQSGQVYILQTRPLHVIEPTPAEGPDISEYEVLLKGGSTVCPGAGAGPVHHVAQKADLPGVPDKAVIVTPHTFPGLITVMEKASAIITATGGAANHMATVAREYRIPTLGGLPEASQLAQGALVTVDATEGIIYTGALAELVNARRPEYELFADMAIFSFLEEVLRHVSPLNLIHPGDENFKPSECQTFHDITRLCHQRAMDEMFYGGIKVGSKDRISVELKSKIPLKVNVIYVDQEYATYASEEGISPDKLASEPMKHFWDGVLSVGWPKPPQAGMKDFMNVMTTAVTEGSREDFSETSFAILSREYMILSLRMGYHFTTLEAMCTDDVGKNYIRMQFKEGGAALERRARRIKLICDVLSEFGFEHHAKADFLDTRLAYQKCDVIRKRLYQLGRLTMLTKQLDMALANDSIAAWYTRDIAAKLNPPMEGAAPV